MKGQRIGYVRVSTLEQNTERQLEHRRVDEPDEGRANAAPHLTGA